MEYPIKIIYIFSISSDYHEMAIKEITAFNRKKRAKKQKKISSVLSKIGKYYIYKDNNNKNNNNMESFQSYGWKMLNNFL